MKEGGISARKAGQMWGLSMKKSTPTQVKLNRKVTSDCQIEVPSPVFFKQRMKKKKTVCRWANIDLIDLIDLAKHGFGLSKDTFLKSVKKFLGKKVRTIPFNSHWHSPPYPSHFLCFISQC